MYFYVSIFLHQRGNNIHAEIFNEMQNCAFSSGVYRITKLTCESGINQFHAFQKRFNVTGCV